MTVESKLQKYTSKNFDIDKIDRQTINILTHLINNTLEDPNESVDLLEMLQSKRETCRDVYREISIFTWFYPGFQILVMDIVLKHYEIPTGTFLLENIIKIMSLLCEESVVCEDVLKSRTDTILHPFLINNVVDFSEKVKLQTLEVYCSIFRTLNGTACDCIQYGEILPIALKIISMSETRLRVKGTYLLFLIISIQIYVDEDVYLYKGLDYSVQTLDRFNAIDMVISPLVIYGINTKNPLLLKNVFRIYLKLCEKPNVRNKLFEENIPEALFSKEIVSILKSDFELNELHKKMTKLMN